MQHALPLSTDGQSLRAQVSHFVLRLAHCRGEELRRWFLAQEGELFAARFREEPGKVGRIPALGAV